MLLASLKRTLSMSVLAREQHLNPARSAVLVCAALLIRCLQLPSRRASPIVPARPIRTLYVLMPICFKVKKKQHPS